MGARVRSGRLALFDLDGTLLRGTSSERRFAAWLFANGHAGAFQACAWWAHALGHAVRDGRDVWRRDKAYIAGLDVSRVAALASAHVDGVLASGGIDTGVCAALERHQRAGDATVLLSGTLQPLAEAYARRLGIPDAVASLAPVVGRRYARGSVLRHPYGPAKRELAEAWHAELGAERRDTVAYGDSIADRALLEWGRRCGRGGTGRSARGVGSNAGLARVAPRARAPVRSRARAPRASGSGGITEDRRHALDEGSTHRLAPRVAS